MALGLPDFRPLFLGAILIGTPAFADDLTLWYNKPALVWMTDALPIGNGSLGAMVFGGVDSERLQFNVDSLWTGDEKDTGFYQNFGDLFIDFTGASGAVSNYRRELDLERAIEKTTYERNGVTYTREIFASYPAQVIVIRLAASRPHSCSGKLRLVDAHGAKAEADQGGIKIAGALGNGLRYDGRTVVLSDGGTVKTTGNAITFDGANSVTILLAAATDYVNQRDRHWRGDPPGPKVEKTLTTAAAMSYAALHAAHLADYQRPFRRVTIDLGRTEPAIVAVPTDQRLAAYTAGGKDPGLEALFFQYGRYLMLASSQPGTLPANLQGLWNESNQPPWRSDYHSNINIQMNYWPVEVANLPECHQQFIDWIESVKPVYRDRTHEQFGPGPGWVVRTENNIFGGGSYDWNITGSAWYMQHYWEHYAYGQDRAYLAQVAYPAMKEICQYWEQKLIKRPDGTLVTPVGWSPEHGPHEQAITYDLEIVHDLFTNTIEAADILGTDQDYRNRLVNLRHHLLQPKVGKWGQLQEWETDRDDPKDDHRHALYLENEVSSGR